MVRFAGAFTGAAGLERDDLVGTGFGTGAGLLKGKAFAAATSVSSTSRAESAFERAMAGKRTV